MQGRLKIWGHDEDGYWEFETTCDKHNVTQVIDQFADGRDGFEDYEFTLIEKESAE